MNYFSAAELADMALPGLPRTRENLQRLAEREAWPRVARTGRGGGFDYEPPANILAQIRERATAQLLADSATLPVPPALAAATPIAVTGEPIPAAQLAMSITDGQRLRADCRKGVLMAIERLMAGCGIGRDAAIVAMLVEAKKDPAGQLARALTLASDERGRKGADAFPSARTIKRWTALDRNGAGLAPQHRQRDMSVPAWAAAFLAIWQSPQKPSVSAAYRIFAAEWASGELPSEHQVRRFIGKLGNVSREHGRMGSRELKNLRPFVRRTFADLLPGDVFSADGHCFDAEVRHPLNGRPFRPEITSVIDIATRRVVGWSIDLAESGLAVVDALRHSATNAAVCSTFYVDNGSGYVNGMLRDEATGLMTRLGITMTHSLPYNSQARGVIERLHQTLWVAAAKELPTYIGADMDRQAGQQVHKLTRRALRTGGAQPLMSWADFMVFAARRVADYNARPHASLGGKSPDQVWAEKGAATDLHRLTPDEAEHLFRPQATRKVQRGEIQLFNNRYFSAALEEHHGEFVRVGYDVHDAHHVWVYDRDGRFITRAEWGANEAAYFPQPVIEQNRQTRETARLRRLEGHADEVRELLAAPIAGELARPAFDAIDVTQQQIAAGLRGAPAARDVLEIETPSEATVTAMSEVRRPMFTREADRYRWLMAHRGAWAEADQEWIENYVGSDDYAQRVDLFEVECIAWQAWQHDAPRAMAG
ncbi:Mu transposase C-terminal domain-containing protein [Chitiniphilus eburneus]|uniref:Mu transposase C-terminal domain-containing protein n=1 Tax=Chitiniphilus eburneus TaxID=2571148 RepID=UPI0035CF9C6A